MVPGSHRPGPDGRHGGLARIRVKAPPTDGRANAEAERILSDALGIRVRLVAGGRARRKTFEAEATKAALDSLLGRVFGG